MARYLVGDEKSVEIEISAVDGFVPAGVGEVAGYVRDAIEPAVAAARVVLDRVADLAPRGVEVKFGVKVTGTANWVVAKAATEGNFEITLKWEPSAALPA
ncbi:CU044_2847 family protein [Actinoplanes sp. L3-i22]|uniref:CU044_2847 family protein n=1 Tax=Actinoplanes sp. L3-i22 TaxID=2836373 RepID=UPI001C7933FC|nr:CU044_2847 family protein [Actinoplanes sp. L3-i22]BCY13123.1 hypothetical protein L3i22_082110 [Actinoplanes sp. L3-i22]